MTAVDTTTGLLSIPDVSELDTCAAALAYAGAGWYVGPCYVGPDEDRNKHPGSILGNGWHHKTSRDPKQIIAWFAGTSGVGIFLHCGRSGAVVFDVDTPDAMPDVLRDNLAWGPYQSTRPDEPGRGHYPFRMPPGRTLGNSRGKLGKAWGEVRGANGVIVVAPSPHLTGRYEWISAGTVPALPLALAELLPDAGPAVDAATDETVEAFLNTFDAGTRDELLEAVVDAYLDELDEGGSRHEGAVTHACWAAREARAGLYSASEAFGRLRAEFLSAATDTSHAGQLRTKESAEAEWAGIEAWAVAQALAADESKIDEVRDRVRLYEEVDELDDAWANIRSPAPVTMPVEGGEEAPGPEEDPPTTWEPIDLRPALAGERTPPPEILSHRAGFCLLYAGRMHTFQGPSETCKSWAAQVAAAEVISNGGDVLYIDFEDDEGGVTERLTALGVPGDLMLERMAYLRPDEPLVDRKDRYTRAGLRFATLLKERPWRLAILDGVTEAMTTEGLDLGDNADAARFSRRIMRPMANTGAAAVAIDHVTKSGEEGRHAIGAQHKLAGLTGASYRFSVERPLARALGTEPEVGVMKITVTKDRPGWVRGRAKDGDVGRLMLTSWPDGLVDGEIVAPADLGDMGADMELAGRVLKYLGTYDGASKNQLEESVTGKREGIRAATTWMVDKRWIEVRKEGVAHRHYLTDLGRKEVPE